MIFSPITLAAVTVGAVICAGALDIWVSYAAIGALAVVFIISSIRIRKIDITAIILLLGFCIGFSSYSFFSSDKIHRSTAYFNKEVSVKGVIITAAQESTTSNNYRYTMRVKSITENGRIEKTNENIILTTPEKLHCGDTVTASGKIKPLSSQMNEYGFDSEKYYKSQGAFSRLYAEKTAAADSLRVFSFSIISGRFREKIDDTIYRYYDGDAAAMLSAILTGNNHHFSPEFDRILNRTSFKRQLHPAFIHILLVTSIMGIIASFIAKKFRDIAIIGILIILAALNGAQVGFVRCALMCAMTIFFRLKNGSAYYPDTLSWFLIICAAVSPLIFFNFAFILSLSAGLIMWAFMPLAKEFTCNMPKRIRTTAAAMFVCVVFYTPISCFYFNGICIYSFLLPFIMIPPVILTLFLAPAVLLCLEFFGKARIIKQLLDILINIILKLPPFIDGLPYSASSIPTPPILVKAVIIGTLITIYYLINRDKKRMKLAAAVSSCCLAAFAVVLIARIGTTNVTFINVGQCEASVIHTAFGKTIVIDGGGGVAYSNYNPGESIFVPYLKSHGYTTIEAAFLSHFHQDHVQGIVDAVNNLYVKRIYVPVPQENWDDEMNEWLNRLKTAAAENGTEIVYAAMDCEVPIDSGMSVSIYAPDEAMNSTKDDNDKSLLFKVHCRGTDFLFTGDITSRGEKAILARGIDADTDVLKVGHHGSAGATSSAWLSAVSAQYAVICCGENNVYGHPRQEVLDRLSGIPVYRTDKNGDISFIVSKRGIRSIHTLKGGSQ